MSQDRSYCYLPLYHYNMWRNIFIPHLKYCNKFGGGIMLISHPLKNIEVFFFRTPSIIITIDLIHSRIIVYLIYTVTTCTELCIAFLLFVSRSRIVPNNSAQRVSAAVPGASICLQIRQSVGHSSLDRFSAELLQCSCFVFPFPIPRYCEKNQPKCLSVSG